MCATEHKFSKDRIACQPTTTPTRKVVIAEIRDICARQGVDLSQYTDEEVERAVNILMRRLLEAVAP